MPGVVSIFVSHNANIRVSVVDRCEIFMNDNEFRLQREIRELKAEVRRLKYVVEGGCVVIGLVAAIVFPQVLLIAAGIAAAILFACLISPVRRLIFSSFFTKRDDA